jgi:hypothetical protein
VSPPDKFLVTLELSIKKMANAAALASAVGVPEDDIRDLLSQLVADAEAKEVRTAFVLTPKGQSVLAGQYADRFKEFRANPSLAAAYDRFEPVNDDLKQLITEWQTMEIAGESVPNDHSNREYDERMIERLAALHEGAQEVLISFASAVPRLSRYLTRLNHALEKAEVGSIEYVSGARIDSYHTVWFELHEELLRILDRVRRE